LLNKLTIQNGSQVEITDNPVLPTLSFPALKDIECTDIVNGSCGVLISNNALLSSIDLSNLENIDKAYLLGFSFTNLPSCTSINLSKLTKGNATTRLGIVYFDNCPLIPSISLPLASVGISVVASNNAALTSVSAPLLTTSGGVVVIANPLLTTVSFPLLAIAESSVIGSVQADTNALLADFSFPALTTTSSIFIEHNPVLTQALFPLLTTITNRGVSQATLSVFDNLLLTTLNFSSLTSVGVGGLGGVNIANNPAIVTVDLSALLSVQESVVVANNVALTTLTINQALVSVVTNNFDFSGNALSQVNVDDILIKFDAGGAVNATLGLAGGTNSGFAALGVAGLAAYNNLVGKGWTINMNA
jgi:hypothetical protein